MRKLAGFFYHFIELKFYRLCVGQAEDKVVM
jgi:hypothetical protein